MNLSKCETKQLTVNDLTTYIAAVTYTYEICKNISKVNRKSIRKAKGLKYFNHMRCLPEYGNKEI